MSTLFFVLIFAIAIYLIMQPDKRAKLAGKIILGIILVPIIIFILFFATCLVIVGVGNIIK